MGRMPPRLPIAGALLAAFVLPSAAAAAAPGPAEIRDGPARFEVISPTLVRLEYAADRSFEDRPTLTVPARDFATPPFHTRVHKGVREIRTARMTLRYRLGSGP